MSGAMLARGVVIALALAVDYAKSPWVVTPAAPGMSSEIVAKTEDVAANASAGLIARHAFQERPTTKECGVSIPEAALHFVRFEVDHTDS